MLSQRPQNPVLSLVKEDALDTSYNHKLEGGVRFWYPGTLKPICLLRMLETLYSGTKLRNYKCSGIDLSCSKTSKCSKHSASPLRTTLLCVLPLPTVRAFWRETVNLIKNSCYDDLSFVIQAPQKEVQYLIHSSVGILILNYTSNLVLSPYQSATVWGKSIWVRDNLSG